MEGEAGRRDEGGVVGDMNDCDCVIYREHTTSMRAGRYNTGKFFDEVQMLWGYTALLCYRSRYSMAFAKAELGG